MPAAMRLLSVCAGLARDEAHGITLEAIFKRNGGIFEGGGIGVGDVEAAIA